MKVALVHDYLSEFGGGERVLLALSEIWPKAPIYTAFYRKDSPAWSWFINKDVRPSWVHYIPFFSSFLHSPLRFLAPLIWGSFDFSDYDVVVASSSWYITRGFRKGPKTKEICYCHTPPRWLYGFKTSINYQRFWPIKIYAAVVGHFMRMYDFASAQKVDYFIANSKNVAGRIKKFYRRDSKVIYPPVGLEKAPRVKRQEYYLIVSRLTGAKGLDIAIEAAVKMGFKLKVAGIATWYYFGHEELLKKAGKNVEFMGFVSDKKLSHLYRGAKAFIATAQDEDFGITPVEAMLAGTPVIALKSGGFVESVVDGKTGVFFKEPTVESLIKAIKKFEKIKINPEDCIRQAKKFSKERFKKEIKEFIEKRWQAK